MKRSAWLILISLSLVVIRYAHASIPPFRRCHLCRRLHPLNRGDLLCYGGGCALALDMMQSQINQELFTPGFPIEDEPPISKAQFCANLKAQRPPNCPNLYPQSKPGIPTAGKNAYTFNEYAQNRLTMRLGDKFLSYIATNTYPGDLNTPASDVIFFGTCQSHNQCWAAGESRSACNLSFISSITNACNGLGSSSATDACEAT